MFYELLFFLFLIFQSSPQCADPCVCDNYVFDETNGPRGSNTCNNGNNCQCTGTRMCSQYGWCAYCSDLHSCPSQTHACPTGTYQYGTRCDIYNCSIDLCQICKSNNDCAQCISPYSLINGLCSCSKGTYYEMSSNTCSSCSIPNCSSCQGQFLCSECNVGYYLLNNTCCPAVMLVSSTNECLTCPLFSYFDSVLNRCVNSSSNCGANSSGICQINVNQQSLNNDDSSNITIIVAVVIPFGVLLIIVSGCIFYRIHKKNRNKRILQSRGGQHAISPARTNQSPEILPIPVYGEIQKFNDFKKAPSILPIGIPYFPDNGNKAFQQNYAVHESQLFKYSEGVKGLPDNGGNLGGYQYPIIKESDLF